MDINYLLFLQEIRTVTGGIFDSLILALTTLGEAALSWGLLALVYWCVDKRAGQLMALNVSFASTMNQGVKNIFKVERPWVQDSRIVPVEKALSHAGGYSFPSGHTTRATAVWGALGKTLWQKKEKTLAGLCVAACFLVAFTRNYLGVHTAKDVLAALIMGFILIVVLDLALSWVEQGKNRDLIVGAAGCLIFLAFMLKVGCLSNAGAGAGILLGWILERRYIRFETDGKFSEKVFRFLTGCLLLVFFYTVPNSILGHFMAGKYAGFFSNFLFTFVLMAGYPYVFSKLEEQMKIGKRTLLFVFGSIVIIGLIGAGLVNSKLNKTTAENEVTSAENVGSEVTGAENTGNEVTSVEIVGNEALETGEVTDSQKDNNAEGTAAQLQAAEEIQQEKKINIIAHRGYSSLFPENTLAAFRGACEIGVDYVELDVQSTKDGVLVIYHDTDLLRTSGVEGNVIDFTYEELCHLEAGSWFGAEFAGEKIPTLEESLEFFAKQDCRLYLELKDIGEAEGFVPGVVAAVQKFNLSERCVYASFNYEYMRSVKELDPEAEILYNTVSNDPSMVQEYPAEYYGLKKDSVSAEVVDAIHAAGSNIFVWTVDEPEVIQNLVALGVDGIVTNKPGLAKVVVHPEYAYLAENFERSFTMPGLYESNLPEVCKNSVVQGFTMSSQYMFISAYSKAGENSILYVMDLEGKLLNVVDLQFVAHTGGISYDPTNDYLWITGPSGQVYAISHTEVISGTYTGNILVSFDAGLVNHNQSKVASFLTWFQDNLYVGSYVDGANGMLNRYDLSDPLNPQLISTVTIPERIQGITLWENNADGNIDMFLSQGYQTLDAVLLCFDYRGDCTEYIQPLASYVLPEGVEQIQAASDGMYLLFESAAIPYRPTSRIPNDQVYVIKMPD